MLNFSDHEVHAEAVRLGIVRAGEDLPRHLRSQAAASLANQTPAGEPPAPAPAVVARSITVRPSAGIDIDDQPFPWIVQADHIEVTLAPDGSGLVRLTIPTKSVTITKPEGE